MNIIIIGIHLKAIPNSSEKCAIRESQAIIIQQIILEYYNNYEIIVIGDFNDYDNAISDYTNNKPNSKVLDIIKGGSGYNPINYKLYNTSEFIEKDKRKTTSMSMIDHILVTKNLTKYIKDVYIFTQYNKNIGTNYNSDHYPIVVDFDFSGV
jgi:endonuclease/exonuclease/phosphatase family metal-dependent hydrolase